MSAKKKAEPTFEEALGELEALVARMEDGDLSLEESIKTYERGVALSRKALQALDEAEQRVEILNPDADRPTDFETDEG